MATRRPTPLTDYVVKTAVARCRWRRKVAGTLTGDAIRGLPATALSMGALGPLYLAPRGAAAVLGESGGPVTDEEREWLTGPTTTAYVPFGNAYLRARRARGVADESESLGASYAGRNVESESGGGIGVAALQALAGAGIGGILGFRASRGSSDRLGGTMTGAGTGLLAGAGIGLGGSLIGSLAAAITRQRSMRDQATVDSVPDRALVNYVLPGRAAYDYWKRLGRSRDWDKDRGAMEAVDRMLDRLKQQPPMAEYDQEDNPEDK